MQSITIPHIKNKSIITFLNITLSNFPFKIEMLNMTTRIKKQQTKSFTQFVIAFYVSVILLRCLLNGNS